MNIKKLTAGFMLLSVLATTACSGVKAPAETADISASGTVNSVYSSSMTAEDICAKLSLE